MSSSEKQNNNSIKNLEANLFIENFIANLLSNEMMNYISPSRIKSISCTEFIITRIVEIEKNQKKILLDLEEIKKLLKRVKNDEKKD